MTRRDRVQGEPRRLRVVEHGAAELPEDPAAFRRTGDGSREPLKDLGQRRIVFNRGRAV